MKVDRDRLAAALSVPADWRESAASGRDASDAWDIFQLELSLQV